MIGERCACIYSIFVRTNEEEKVEDRGIYREKKGVRRDHVCFSGGNKGG